MEPYGHACFRETTQVKKQPLVMAALDNACKSKALTPDRSSKQKLRTQYILQAKSSSSEKQQQQKRLVNLECANRDYLQQVYQGRHLKHQFRKEVRGYTREKSGWETLDAHLGHSEDLYFRKRPSDTDWDPALSTNYEASSRI